MYSEKQIQIMETAEILFAEKGFNGTSIRDISEKAGVNLAMVSYYFGSKEKLFETLFDYRSEAMKVKLETLIGRSDLSAMEKVNLLIDNYMEKIFSQQSFHRILAREQVVNNSIATASLILEMKKRNLELISKLIHEGQRKGEFRKNIDIPMMMTTLIGTANSLVTTKHYYRELNKLQDLTDEEFEKNIRKKLNNHLKFIFKAILTHEA